MLRLFFAIHIPGPIFSKDCLPVALKSFVVCKFTCAGCQSWYIREIKRHLRIEEQSLAFFNT